MDEIKIIKPQEGFQEYFTRTNVDFVIGGGVLNPIPVDRLVSTPSGFVRMGDLKVGDIVSNPIGGTQRINMVIDRGERECVEFILDDGRVVESDLDHNWRIKYREYELRNVTAQFIIDKIEANRNIDNRHRKSVRIPLTEPVEYNLYVSNENRPIPPYVLGCLLGDGWFTDKSGIGFFKPDMEVIDRMRSLGCILNPQKQKGKYSVGNKEYRETLKKLGLWNRYCYNKFIPDSYKYAPIYERMELIRGLMDTDGTSSIREGRFRVGYRTVSPFLRDDLREMLWSIGAKVSICTTNACVRKRKIGNDLTMNCRESYGFYIVAPDNRELFHLTRKKKNCQADSERKVKLMLTVKDYRLTGKKHCKCINVSGEEHLFLTDNFVVTCNCGKSFSAVMSIAEPAQDPHFRSLFLRNNLGDLRAGGSILDTFREVYGDNVKIIESGEPRVIFPSGAYVDVTHVADQSREKVMQRFKGRQYDHIYFDEGTGFTWECFTTIYSRNRGTAKWTGHVAMTTNPERDHWIRQFIDWYIGVDGYIREDRNGVIRYFYINGESVKDVVWGDTKEDVYAKCKIDIDRKIKSINGKNGTATWADMIKSFTFYLGRMSENKASIGTNKGYVGSVAMTGGRIAQQLLEGNWNVSTKDDLDAPISTDEANFVFLNDPQRNGDKWITADLADTGTDNFLAIYWDGFHADDILIMSKSTPRMNAEKLHVFAVEHDVPDSHIIYDAVRGTYINDYIPDAVQYVSYRTPIGLYGRGVMKLKDECYLRLVDVIKKQHLSFADWIGEKIYDHANMKERITIANEFIEECSVVRFRDGQSGKKTLYSKKEMNQKLGKSRSMDLLDPCAMRMLPVLSCAYGDELTRTKRREYEDKEYDDTFDVENVNVFDDTNWY